MGGVIGASNQEVTNELAPGIHYDFPKTNGGALATYA